VNRFCRTIPISLSRRIVAPMATKFTTSRDTYKYNTCRYPYG
jgi:hypothetical protein